MLTVLGEAERFGAVCANRLDVTACSSETVAPAGCRCAIARPASRFEIRAANVVNATGVWADELRPHELHDEAELPRIRPSRGTHITSRHEDLPLVGGAIVPAGGGRTIFALPWLGRTLVGTTDNDYEGSLEHIEPSREDIDYLLEAVNEFFATELSPADMTGAYAGVRPLISTGDPQEIGRHLAQGRAVRDLLRHDHDHRRQAHHLAADGEARRRPSGRARSARRSLPHAEIPLGQAVPVEELPAVRGSLRGSPARHSPPAMATAPTRRSRWPPSAGSWPSRSCPGCPT